MCDRTDIPCEVCEGSGMMKVPCDNCGGTGKDEVCSLDEIIAFFDNGLPAGALEELKKYRDHIKKEQKNHRPVTLDTSWCLEKMTIKLDAIRDMTQEAICEMVHDSEGSCMFDVSNNLTPSEREMLDKKEQIFIDALDELMLFANDLSTKYEDRQSE